jgi:hypothetical protein
VGLREGSSRDQDLLAHVHLAGALRVQFSLRFVLADRRTLEW